MVKVLIGNLFESKAQTLVNTINCVGVMGKGVALEFKKRFPEMYEDYVKKCNSNEVKLGEPYLYKYLIPPNILNFPTKDHWRSVSNLSDIILGLDFLIKHCEEWEITSLAVPPLGCGQGQLEWRIVGPTLFRYLNKLNIPIELYAPYGTPHEELQPDFLDTYYGNTHTPTRIDLSWVALVEILSRIEEAPYHWPVGRTIFQKIAYIATKEGLPTGLKFYKKSYGPYSDELKGLITKLLNNGLIREEQQGNMFSVKVGPTFKDALKIYNSNISQWEIIIRKTTDLFMRMNTPQAEMVATVIYAADELVESNNIKPTEEEVLRFVMEWKKLHRPPLDKNKVASTIRNLASLSWLNVTPSKSFISDFHHELD